MAYSPVVDVQITINSINLTQAGFGTPIFICAHQQTDERVIDVTTSSQLTDAVEDGGFGFTVNSAAYIAADQFFKNSPSPTVIKIGRRGGITTSRFNSVDGDISETYSISVNYLSGSTYNAVYAHVASTDDAESIATELVTQLLSSEGADIDEFLSVRVKGTGQGATIEITSLDNDYTFQVDTSTALHTNDTFSTEFSGTEEAMATIDALVEFNSDFYFVTSEVRPASESSFCEKLAMKVQTLDKTYFVSSGAQADIDLISADTSFFKYAKENGLTHTVTLHHQYGSSKGVYGESYPECYFVGFNAPYDAGSVTWCNLNVALPASGQPSNPNKPLNPTQLGRLMENNVNYVQLDAGVNILRTGVTSGGEWIDVIRGVHWLTEDLTVSLKGLLFNVKGGKVPFSNSGIARIREVCQSSLQRAVNRNFLDSYTLVVPLLSEVSNIDWVARALKGITFIGILSGAINTIEVVGQVTTPTAA
jgi:hypothetical protein